MDMDCKIGAGQADHPPVAWEHACSSAITSWVGSSPRRRGTLVLRLPQMAYCAGSSPRRRGTRRILTSALDPVLEIGSSPRRRGTRTTEVQPGCATTSTWDHPRVGGEHLPSSDRRSDPAHGSSPRRRGTHEPSSIELGSLKSDHPRVGGEHARAPSLLRRRRSADHPRVGGEHAFRGRLEGLPPRTDHPRVGGEHFVVPSCRPCLRIIPA